VVADRISVRWPDHAEGFPAGRSIGWRTVVVAGFGALALGMLPGQAGVGLPLDGGLPFGGEVLQSSRVLDSVPVRLDPGFELAIFGAYVLVLTLLLAIDLDQRLLPDVFTLTMIPLAFLFALSGRDPFVGDALVPAIVAALAIPAVLYLPSLAFGAGAFGLGDVKLLVTVGLISGAYRAILGVMAGLLFAGVVIVLLLVARRITLKTYIPFGPFLVIGALWALVVRI
jgi:prepilin signal peptidase PulO-like enzyme (type II secretory pathway)